MNINELILKEIIKEQNEKIKELETVIFTLKLDKEYKQILGIQTVEKENQQLKENWNKLKEYLNKQIENFKKMLKTDYGSNEMLGKLWFAEEILNKINKNS